MLFNSQWCKGWMLLLIFIGIIIPHTTTASTSTDSPISCMEYKRETCPNGTSCTYRNVTCRENVKHCMAVLKYTPTDLHFDILTCWPQWESTNKDCPSEEGECKLVQPSKIFYDKRNLIHCCCKGNLCNDKERLKKMDFKKIIQSMPKRTPNPRSHPRTRPPKFEDDKSELDFRRGSVMFTAVIILVPLLVICLFIIFAYWLWRRYDCCQRVRAKPGQDLLLGGSGGSGAVTDEASLLGPGAIGPDGYKLGTLISMCQTLVIRSRGRYGCVWQSKMRGSPFDKEDQTEHEVAVKIFPPQDRQSWITEQEIYRLRGLQHPNILRYIGADQFGENVHAQLWIVTEYHPVGSVADYLRSNTVMWPQLLTILRSMAEGMRHLHEERAPHKPSIAHRDLKSKNVLLKSNLREVCIADMGLALKFDVGQRVGDTHAQVGTRRYMAPEVLEGAIQFSRDSFLRIDTYAMALVMWELMSRCNFREEHSNSDTTVADEDKEDNEAAYEEEADEGLAMLEGDSSPRSTPSHSPGANIRNRVMMSGAAAVYRLPFEAELGPQPTLEAMQDLVVQRKQRPKMSPDWRQHEGMQQLWETLEECWDQDAEARLSAGLVMVRMEALEAQLPPSQQHRASDVLVRHALHRQPDRQDSSSSALGSSASSLHPTPAVHAGANDVEAVV